MAVAERILIVDDSQDDAELMVQALRRRVHVLNDDLRLSS
jgi:hypothetical protein